MSLPSIPLLPLGTDELPHDVVARTAQAQLPGGFADGTPRLRHRDAVFVEYDDELAAHPSST